MAWVPPSPASYVLGPGTPDFRLPVHLPSTLCSHHLPQEMLEPGAKICQPRVQQVVSQESKYVKVFPISCLCLSLAKPNWNLEGKGKSTQANLLQQRAG